MIWRRALLLSLLFAPAVRLEASTLVVRDSIGDSSASTDEMPGAVADHNGADWSTPGLVVNVPQHGRLHEARFVIFAVSGRGPFFPENSLANVYGYPMEFHLWTEGILGGADSYDENPRGLETVPGHISLDVNTTTASYITVEPFGYTGPQGNVNAFTTFLVTIELSSFNVLLQGDNEYVMTIIQDNANNFITGTGGFFRISASKQTGFEDLFQTFDSTTSPGYVQSQLGNVFQQYAGALTLAPLVDGDYDFDGVVGGTDFLAWQRAIGSDDSMADGNDDGVVDGADLQIWIDKFGEGASASGQAGVPEPGAGVLVLVACSLLRRRKRVRGTPPPHRIPPPHRCAACSDCARATSGRPCSSLPSPPRGGGRRWIKVESGDDLAACASAEPVSRARRAARRQHARRTGQHWGFFGVDG